MRKYGMRIGTLVLALMLLLSSALAQDATIFQQGNDDTSYRWAQDIAVVGDTLYFNAYTGEGNSLWYYKADMKDAAQLEGEVINASSYSTQEDAESNNEGKDTAHLLYGLFGSDKLLSLNPYTGLIFEITNENGKLAYKDIVTLKDPAVLLTKDGDNSYLSDLADKCVMGDTMYMLSRGWSNEGWSVYTLYAVSLTDGSMKTYESKNITTMTPYKDGKLLVRVFDDQNAWNNETQEMNAPSLGIFDPATDTIETVKDLPSYNSNGLRYNADTDTTFYFEKSKVMGMKALGDAVQMAYVPADYAQTFELMGDSVVLNAGSNTGIFLRTLSDNYNADVFLNVYGSYMDDGEVLFASRYPSVPIYNPDKYYETTDALSQAMVSGEDSIDVLRMSVGYQNFITMRDKGYCADLSAYPELMDAVSKMQPCIRDLLIKDGKLYGIPVEASSWGNMVNTAVMEEMGLTWDDMPKNFVELCEFISRWNDEWVEEYPNYIPMYTYGSAKSQLFNTALTDYLNYCDAKGEEVSFDTPIFRELMQAVENVSADEIDGLYGQGDEDEYWSRTSLIDTGYQIAGSFSYYESKDMSQQILPLTLTANTDFVVGMDVTVMFVNPRTKNMDYAVKLLECQMEKYRPEMKYTLDTTCTEPVLNPDYENMVESNAKNLAQMKEALAKADDSEKKDIEQNIEWMESYIARQENYRYTISQEALDYFNENIAPFMYVVKPTFMNATQNDATTELNTLIQRYNDGQISLEQFIRDADKKMRMIQMEDY